MFKPRDIAYCAVFGAAAMLLPVIFHVFHLGSIFMPMYLPLVTLAFFVGPVPAATTAILLPLISGALTGMPPFFPPVAFIMSIELSIMCTIIALCNNRFVKVNKLFILVPTLVIGRLTGVALIYLMAVFMKLPAKFVAGASLLSGWPGIVLMVVAIPSVLRLSRVIGVQHSIQENTHV
jgi:hypothetical protein